MENQVNFEEAIVNLSSLEDIDVSNIEVESDHKMNREANNDFYESAKKQGNLSLHGFNPYTACDYRHKLKPSVNLATNPNIKPYLNNVPVSVDEIKRIDNQIEFTNYLVDVKLSYNYNTTELRKLFDIRKTIEKEMKEEISRLLNTKV